MSELPEVVTQAWDKRQGPFVLATVDEAGQPNIIYVGSVRRLSEGRIVIADNYFDKTRTNILAGSQGALLFITEDKKAYQLKGTFEYLTSGDIYEEMRGWVDPKHPRRAAAVLHVTQVYNGASRLA